MVLSLLDICRISLRDSIENGKLPNVHSLPSILGQSILDMVLMHGTINKSNCLATLSSVDFLRNFTSFSTQCGKIDDNRFLKQVRKSMQSIDTNEATIGSSIKELHLRFIGTNNEGDKTNFCSVVRLIKECTNLKILNLSMRKTVRDTIRHIVVDDHPETEPEAESESLTIFHDSAFGGLLNHCIAMEPCLSVMENLDELSLEGPHRYPLVPSLGALPLGAPFLIDHYPIIKFKNLSKLRLRCCKVDGVAWRHFLKSIRSALISLHIDWLEIVSPVDEIRNNILLVSLLRLKSLSATKFAQGYIISKAFLENLADCQELEYVCLELNNCNDEADLMALNRMDNFRLDIGACIHLKNQGFDANQVFDNKSRFKLIDIFKEKLKKFELHVHDENILFATALEHVVNVCTNLTKFHFLILFDEGMMSERIERLNSALTRLFSDEKRASKIRDLYLFFDVNSEVLTFLFRNCVNVKSMSVAKCSRLHDHHLTDWAHRGARPSEICIFSCLDIGDEGLVPILISSGERLKKFEIPTDDNNQEGEEYVNVTERTWRLLADRCRNLVVVHGIPETFRDSFLIEKCFNGVIDRT